VEALRTFKERGLGLDARIIRVRLHTSIIFFALQIFISSPKILSAQTPIFVGESLLFQVTDSMCVVVGKYSFQNPSDVKCKTRLFYPVLLNDGLVRPHKYEVRYFGTDINIPYAEIEAGISFILEIDPFSATDIYVQYWQAAEKQRFNYILTSTRRWGRALEYAAYEIQVPTHLELESCSLEIDSTIIKQEYSIHFITRENYLPKNDFNIVWGKK